MSDFTAGFSARHDTAAQILQRAFSPVVEGFAPSDIRDRAIAGPVSFSPQDATPKHFEPADPETNPTEGWDPFDPDAAMAPQAEAAEAVTPPVDPVAAAHAAGYAEAIAREEDDISRDRALLTELAAALSNEGRIDRGKMARQLRQTVLLLVSRLVGEIGVSAEILTARIEMAVDLLADSAESAMVRVHPDDVPLLEGALPKTVFTVGDESIARGSFVLESASTIVEDGPALWLEQLTVAIDRVALPR